MQDIVNDNRGTCGQILPSGCVPYTGYQTDDIKEKLPCNANINDIIKYLLDIIDTINKNLGDNSKLSVNCLTDIKETSTQQEINQVFINVLCDIKNKIVDTGSDIDIANIDIAIDILCLNDASCEPKLKYSLLEILTKLISGYCNLLNRIKVIENILNI